MYEYDDIHIIIKSIIGILMAVIGGRIILSEHNLEAIVMLTILPLICSILFWKFKHPVFGITYTVLFLLNRIDLFIRPRGTLLGYAIIVALLAYFVFVDRKSCLRLKEIKERKAQRDAE